MFNQTVLLLRLQFFLESLSKSRPFYKRYVFQENTNDLITLHGLQYEQEHFVDANDRSISIVGSPRFGFPQHNFIDLLQQLIHFKKRIFHDELNWQKYVLIGLFDMNLVVYSSDLPYQSLHPITSGSHQLFVVNMGMIGTPTYFVELFDVYLWTAFLASFTLIGVLSSLGIYLLQRYTTTRFDYLAWFSTLTNQGGEKNSRLIFPKLLLVPLSILAIIFHGSFGAFLSSYLAIRNPDIPFMSLDGLMQIPDYSVCSPCATSSHKYLMDHIKSDAVILQRVNNKNCPEEFKLTKVTTQRDEFKDFCPSDKTVYFLPVALKIGNDKCPVFNFIALRENYAKQYYTILVSPGFKYREQFNRGLIRLRTAGFIKRFEIQLQRASNNILRPLGHLEDDPTIDFHQTQIIFLIPVVATILGIIILMLELLYKNY